ncbi:succinyl-diaminopimelate desuccinylase [Catellatospora sp. KI3]|uniref:succinyl-diaminopimelate desuccinylase n=1 Tax=Catellatospora sp. KI3 TaxID=3041620 RepID=UPI0024826FF8|nr:succinyl-diaminopimelate desuccinylase [Catellatospora sp. KI3]MDI1459862.1 succinyl-diaminopimelate desuccinylase [Catellatospora sp. KI3]
MSNPLTPQVLADPVALTRALVDIESVSGDEKEIADAVEQVLRDCAHLRVERIGHTVIARTELGREQRVVLAGHLDTVPIADNFPSTTDGKRMWGCGTSDMKSGTALALHLAVTVDRPRYDATYFFYECEEVEAVRNGLKIVADLRPELLRADFAILLEPTYGVVEAGCQGTMRAKVRTHGVRAHAARSWLGDNAIHKAGEVLRRLEQYQAREVMIDGCRYREGLNAVKVTGGVAGNVIPDECEVEINFRFAPDRSVAQAEEHLREVMSGYDVEITDFAPGALPGLEAPPAAQFLAATGAAPAAKLGWTDVARFAELGIPALNFGPGDPNLAHKRDEHVELEKIEQGAALLRRWLEA